MKTKVKEIEIDGRKNIVAHFSRDKFTDDDLSTNRPFRVLDAWVTTKPWKRRVHYYVEEKDTELEFIIIVDK